jgi:hypothetical protein
MSSQSGDLNQENTVTDYKTIILIQRLDAKFQKGATAYIPLSSTFLTRGSKLANTELESLAEEGETIILANPDIDQSDLLYRGENIPGRIHFSRPVCSDGEA